MKVSGVRISPGVLLKDRKIMGYYTWYSIEKVQGDPEVVAAFEADFENGNIPTEYGSLDQMFSASGDAHDSMKWYDRVEDMTNISIAYANTLFVVSGQGEDHDDVWREYYRNGVMERVYPIITYDDPSPMLLNNEPMPGTADNEDIADENF
jgi:hypothetical protein